MKFWKLVCLILLVSLSSLPALFAQDNTIPMPGDDSVPMPGDESVPMPGDDSEVPLPDASSEGFLLPFDFRGYLENTTNVEYLVQEEKAVLLNAGRARVNLSGKPDPSFDYGIGLVGTLNSGETEISLIDYLPDDLQQQIIPGAEEIFVYHLEEEDLYLQEAFGSFYADRFWIRVGRHKYYTGTGYAYNPIDLFNVKDPLDPTYEIDGIDAFLLAFDLPHQTELQGLMRFGDDFENTDYLARMKTYIKGWDLALQYSYYLKERIDWEALNSEEALEYLMQGASFEDFSRNFRWQLVGGEFSGDIWGWAVYGEGGYVFIDSIGNIGTLEDADQDHERLLLGIDHTFDIQLYVLLEYLRLGQGRTDSADITLNDRMAYFNGEILSIDRDTLFTGGSYPLTDLMDLSLYAVIGCNSPSVILNPWLMYSLRPGLNLSLSGNFPFGEDDSQNGKAGAAGFVRLKWNF